MSDHCLELSISLSSGTKEIYVDVDEDGVISMVFECSHMNDGSEFIWSKNYQTITDTSRLTIINEGNKWVCWSCWFTGKTLWSNHLHSETLSCSGPELFSTVSPWRIWASSPVWSPTLKACPPATHSPRRVSQLAVLTSLPLRLDFLVYHFVPFSSLLRVCVCARFSWRLQVVSAFSVWLHIGYKQRRL